METLDTLPAVSEARMAPESAHLRGSRLVLAHVGWTAAVALVLGLLISSVPRRFAELLSPPNPAVRASIAVFGFSPQFHASYNLAFELAGAIGFIALAALIFIRRPTSPPAIGVSFVLIAFGAALPGTSYALISSQPIWRVSPAWLQALGWMGMLFFALLFPDGHFVPRWTRILVPLWVLWVAGFFLFAEQVTYLRPAIIGLSFAMWVGWFGVGVCAQVYRYARVSSPQQRLQTKWVMLGFVGALAGALVASLQHVLSLTTGVANHNSVLFEGAAVALLNLSALLIPLSIAIAILRHNLYDIDRLINLTLVYGALTGVLALVYIGFVTLLQVLFQTVTGERGQSQLALVVSTLAIAALFQPLRVRIQRSIDRRFYRRKYDSVKTIERFSAGLRTETDIAELTGALLTVVHKTMRPAHASLWLAKVTTDADGLQRPKEPGGVS